MIRRTIVLTKFLKKKTIVFVAHEFGLFPGHGGIAAYLYNICKYLLENTHHNIVVIAAEYDKNTDLSKYKNFTLYSISDANLAEKRDRVLKILISVKPDYVEFAEYLALGLHCVLDKTNGKNFKNTVFVTNNHTATKECYEWNEKKSIIYAPFEIQNLASQEAIQIAYSDYCIAPSKFLGKYVKKNYNLSGDVLWFMNPFFDKLKTKTEIIKELSEKIDFKALQSLFNITLITRFEGRKCQDRLINAFIKFLPYTKYKANLYLAGNTSYLPNSGLDYRFELFKSISKKERKNIHFFDFLPLEKQESLIAVTDLVVMPSTFENQPMAMIETVLRGIPIIASKYSGCADYINNDMLFDPFDENSLVQKIKNFYNLSEEQRTEIASMQKEQLQKILNPEKCILPRFELKPKQPHHLSLNLEDLYHE